VPDSRQWRKVHIGIDAETLEICAIEVMSNARGDAEVWPDMIEQIPEDEVLVSVHGDGARSVNRHGVWGGSFLNLFVQQSP